MIINSVVIKAGYNFIGHYGFGELKIVFENVCMRIKEHQVKQMNELFFIFDIDSENGVYLQEIEGKYCRLEFDEEGYLIKVGHLIKDKWFDVIR